jgi:hypothetical protein
MKRAVVAAVALLFAPSAEAKFRMTLTLEPGRPVARATARLTLRTDVALARPHGIRLFAVGPWRAQSGQGSFEVKLRRAGPRTLEANVRFPYPGRWHLDVPPSGATARFAWWTNVRPR